MRLIDADKLAKEVTEAFYNVQIGRELDEQALKIITVVHKGIQDWIADTDTVDENDLEVVQYLRAIAEVRERLIKNVKQGLTMRKKKETPQKESLKTLW